MRLGNFERAALYGLNLAGSSVPPKDLFVFAKVVASYPREEDRLSSQLNRSLRLLRKKGLVLSFGGARSTREWGLTSKGAQVEYEQREELLERYPALRGLASLCGTNSPAGKEPAPAEPPPKEEVTPASSAREAAREELALSTRQFVGWAASMMIDLNDAEAQFAMEMVTAARRLVQSLEGTLDRAPS